MHLLRWHHRLGIAAAAFLLLLAATGFMLNHSPWFGWQNHTIQSPLLLKWYGIKPPEISSYPVNGNWLSHLGGSHLYLDDKQLTQCRQPYQGALAIGNMVVAACAGELVLLTGDGEEIERLGALQGVPAPIVRLGSMDERLLIEGQHGAGIYDMDEGGWRGSATDLSRVHWAEPGQLPESLRRTLHKQFTGSELNSERLLLDLHSGRLFGSFGVYLYDLMALFFCMLGMSGVWVWYTRPGPKFHRRRK
jgi:hypothetical protein